MKLKKFLAVLCACVLVFSLAVTAFAADATNGEIPNGTETKFEGSMPDENTTVSVSVLTGLTKLYVNPYGLPYTLKDGKIGDLPANFDPEHDTDTRDTIKEGMTTDGWFSTTAVIKNDAETKLKVSVTLTTTEKGNVKVVEVGSAATPTAPTSATVTANTLYGNFEITDADYSYTDHVIKASDTWDADNKVPIPAGSGQPGVAGTPTAPTYTKYDIDGAQVVDGVTYSTYAAFRLRGSAVMPAASAGGASPGDASGWLKTDLADVTVAFSFAPVTP